MKWIIVMVLLCAGTLFAEEKADPSAKAQTHLEFAKSAMNHAEALESYMAKLSGAKLKIFKDSAEAARKEYGAWVKSSEAFAQNQIRKGEKYAKDAMEFADERTKNDQEISEVIKRLDANDPEKLRRKEEFEKARAEREKALGN